MVGLLIAWCGALSVARWIWSGHLMYGFLAWNLFLAALPAVASTMFGRAMRRGATAWVCVAWFAMWLLFLPNSPYIVTDFVHLDEEPGVPIWFDIALLASAAGTGLLLAFASTAEIQRELERRWGALAGWSVACIALLLSGLGIYLGRFMRWNSWDVVADPRGLLGELAARLTHPRQHPATFAVTLVYGVGLVLGYVALRAMVHAEGEERGER